MARQGCVERHKIVGHNTTASINRASFLCDVFQRIIKTNTVSMKKFSMIISADNIAGVFIAIFVGLLNRSSGGGIVA